MGSEKRKKHVVARLKGGKRAPFKAEERYRIAPTTSKKSLSFLLLILLETLVFVVLKQNKPSQQCSSAVPWSLLFRRQDPRSSRVPCCRPFLSSYIPFLLLFCFDECRPFKRKQKYVNKQKHTAVPFCK